jgi:hypothetical protein
MKSKLLRLIFDYSKNGKLVDKAYLEKLIDLVVNSKDISKYVQNSEIVSSGTEETMDGILLAEYRPNRKLIRIYSEAMERMLQELFNGIEQIFYKNVLITQIILHELEHANQRRIIEKEDTLESKVLKTSVTNIDIDLVSTLLNEGFTIDQILYYIRREKTLREEHYLLLPDERIAEIRSHQEIVRTLEPIKEYTPNLIEFEKANILENMLRGYFYNEGVITSPTLEYASASKRIDKLKSFQWFDENNQECLRKARKELSLKKRVTYGLPLDVNEFSTLSTSLLLSKKYQY